MQETSLLNKRTYHLDRKVTPIKRISHSMSCVLGYNLTPIFVSLKLQRAEYVKIKYDKKDLHICCHCYNVNVTLLDLICEKQQN